MKKRGRPKKEEGERRDKTLPVRFSGNEVEGLRDAAVGEGSSLTRYARGRLLKKEDG